MPEYPNNSCYTGHPNFPACLNGKPKQQIKQILVYDLQNGYTTREAIESLQTNSALNTETQAKITDILDEI